MGILERIVTKNRCSLAAQSLVGRSSTCLVRIEDPRVSGVHAMIVWNGERWEARDLGSSNGTVVDGRKLVGDPGRARLRWRRSSARTRRT